MQVANDAASANELPTREAGPGRRVSNSAAPESCRAASPRGLRRGAAFVPYEASSDVSALAAWSAKMLASRLASCAATKASVARPSRAFAILVSTLLCPTLRFTPRLSVPLLGFHDRWQLPQGVRVTKK